ncbi:DUF1731 domain-containing protein, partial [Enterobacter hormaechei]
EYKHTKFLGGRVRCLKETGAVVRVRARAFRLVMCVCWGVVGAGPRARPKRLEAAGFTFRWYDLEEALGDVVQ